MLGIYADISILRAYPSARVGYCGHCACVLPISCTHQTINYLTLLHSHLGLHMTYREKPAVTLLIGWYILYFFHYTVRVMCGQILE